MPSRAAAAPVPFTARVEQTINEAVRFPQQVAPDEFPVRMLRDVRVSPDGKAVVYSALGRLYIKPLPDGQPRRLTSEDRLEFSPSFSRDGQWIVYVTWTDAEFGPGADRARRRCGGARRRHGARALCRSVVLPGRSEDCLQAARRRPDPRAVLRRGCRVSTSSRPPAALPLLVRDEAEQPGIRSHRHADLRHRSAQREGHAAERRPADRRFAAAGPRRDRARAQRQRHAVRRIARRQVDRVRGAVQDLHRPVPAHRPAGRYRPGHPVLSGAARLPRCGLLTCTGPPTADVCTGPSGPSCSRATLPTPFRSPPPVPAESAAAPRHRAKRSGGQGDSHRVHRQE